MTKKNASTRGKTEFALLSRIAILTPAQEETLLKILDYLIENTAQDSEARVMFYALWDEFITPTIDRADKTDQLNSI